MVMRLAPLRVRPALLVLLVSAGIAGLVDLRATRLTHEYWNPRVAQRQQIRWLSAYITAYARKYGRPAFHLDSVVAHLDSATARQFRTYLVDLWGERVYYWWNEQTFELSSAAGLSPDRRARMEDSVRTLRFARGDTAGLSHPFALTKRFEVREEYWWPAEARGRRNRWGQYTRDPIFNEPILIRAEPIPRTERRDPPSRFPYRNVPGLTS